MRSNIYDVEETIIVVGSCLKNMQPEGYKKIEKNQKIYMNCVQKKLMDLRDIVITNYVIVDNDLIEIDNNIISMSKSLEKIKNKMQKLTK